MSAKVDGVGRGSDPEKLSHAPHQRVYGIVISLYWAEHPPPHFHARYGEHRAAVDIAMLEVIAGGLPSRAMRLVREWGELHRAELAATWKLALAHGPLGRIEPLP